MATINANETTTLRIGKSGTSKTIVVLFDITDWLEEYGEGGTVVLLHRRSMDKKSYPVATMLKDGAVHWKVSSTDTAWAGYGKAELQYIVDDTVLKSQTWRTIVDASADKGGYYDKPESTWVEHMLADIEALLATAPSVSVEETDDGVLIIGSDGSTAELSDGEAATIEIGTVTTVDADEEAAVTNSGTSTAAILDFEIPRGETGNIYWPEFDIDIDRGMLVLTTADEYNGPSFTITEGGRLEVSYA